MGSLFVPLPPHTIKKYFFIDLGFNGTIWLVKYHHYSKKKRVQKEKMNSIFLQIGIHHVTGAYTDGVLSGPGKLVMLDNSFRDLVIAKLGLGRGDWEGGGCFSMELI